MFQRARFSKCLKFKILSFGKNRNVQKKMNLTNSVLILASGLSERMGRPKALLQWDQSKTFIEKIIEEYLEAGCGKVVCTVNRHVLPFCTSLKSLPNLKFVLNRHPEWGRMYSVKLGLKELAGSSFCFIQNVDNPFIHSKNIMKILEAGNQETWCSPEYKGQGGHPVLLPKSIINQILLEKDLSATLQQVLRIFPKKEVEMEDNSILKNINTPEDYLNLLILNH